MRARVAAAFLGSMALLALPPSCAGRASLDAPPPRTASVAAPLRAASDASATAPAPAHASAARPDDGGATPALARTDAPPCPVAPRRTAPDTSLESPPVYDRATWLMDSLAVADVVVRGRFDRSTERLAIDAVLCGTPDPARLEGSRARALGPRFSEADGIWMLVAAHNGYFAVNPDAAPLGEDEWRALAAQPAAAPPAGETHTVQPSLTGSELITHLTLRVPGAADYLVMRAIDQHGLRLMVFSPGVGRGYEIRYHNGRLWEFRHSLDGRAHGLERTYFDDGVSPRSERRFRNGLQSGRSRTFRAPGVEERTEQYSEGLPEPVVRYRGPGGGATITRSQFGVYYSAPTELIQRIRVGASVATVSGILRADFSPSRGIRFSAWSCEEDYEVRFRGGRVVFAGPIQNGRHCD